MKVDDLPERFVNKIRANPESGCWDWVGALGSRGYGEIRWPSGKRRLAHRLVYEMLVGPIPDGLQIDHLCRVRNCVNPAHMEPVNNRVNTLRGEGPTAVNARKTHCVHGHPLEGPNLYVSRGKRQCRTCQRRLQNVKRTLMRRKAREAR